MSDELELLFSKDVPVVPEVDFDYKKMRAPYIKYSLRFDRTRRLGYEKV